MNVLTKIANKTVKFLKQNNTHILAGAASVGVIFTGVLAAKGATKNVYILEEAKKKKGEELTKKEKFKVTAATYIPAITTGAATITCIITGDILNTKKQKALISSYMLLSKSCKEYRDKVIELYGEEADQAVKTAIVMDKKAEDELLNQERPDGVNLYFDEKSGRWFSMTEQRLLEAEYHFNRNFVLRGYTSLNDFYDQLDIERTEYGDTVGWNLYAGEIEYGYNWVDFYHRRIEDDGEVYYLIEFPFEPTPDYLEY